MALLCLLLLAPAPAPAAALPRGLGVDVGWACCAAPAVDRLHPAWYVDYRRDGLWVPGIQYVRMAWSSTAPADLAALAARHPGQAWILGNEPNDPAQDPQSPAAYVATARAQAAAIRGADPTAAIISAGLAEGSTWWAQAIVDAGGGDLFDAWNIHSYSLVGDPYDLGILQARVTRFAAWQRASGQGSKPLIVGEWGVWPSDNPARAAAYLRSSAAWLRACGCVRAWGWFSARSPAGHRWGGDLLAADDHFTPAGVVFRAGR